MSWDTIKTGSLVYGKKKSYKAAWSRELGAKSEKPVFLRLALDPKLLAPCPLLHALIKGGGFHVYG
jgi:hypothetical protein